MGNVTGKAFLALPLIAYVGSGVPESQAALSRIWNVWVLGIPNILGKFHAGMLYISCY